MLLGRVVRMLEGTTRVQLVNGHWLDFDDAGDDLSVGDCVFVEDTGTAVTWEAAPEEIWPVRPVAAKFLKMDGSLAVVHVGGSISRASISPGLQLTEGNDIWLDDSLGVVAVANLTPLETTDAKQPDSAGELLSFADFAGYPHLVRRTRKLLDISLKRQEDLAKLGARPIRGVLFWGLPGTGKTLLARIIAHSEEVDFYLVNGPEIVSKWVGDSEAELRNIFSRARQGNRPAIIFIDEIDSVAPARSDESHESSKRLVAQLLTEMDGFRSGDHTIVIGATNRREDIDPALRRPGRFDWEVHFPLPEVEDRTAILEQLAAKGGQDGLTEMLRDIASKTGGWSGAELSAIWTEAAILAVSDGRDSIMPEDLDGAMNVVRLDRGKQV